MDGRIPVAVVMVCLLTASLSGAAHAGPAPGALVGACAPGVYYDPACDVDHDGIITITDIQLTAGHWNHAGTYASDNSHVHLGQTWTGTNALVIDGAYDAAPLMLSNTLGAGLEILEAGDTGVFIGPSMRGVHVYQAATNGLLVSQAGRHGLEVVAAAENGVQVGAAGLDGVYVHQAGAVNNPTTSANSNGFEVAGAQGHGLYVGRANSDGIVVNSTGYNGVVVQSAGTDGVAVASAADDGLHIQAVGDDGVFVVNAGYDGVQISEAGHNGVYVPWAHEDGVRIDRAGSPSTTAASASFNGFEVTGAQGHGLWVGRADVNGVEVHEAGYDALYVGAANRDGVRVAQAGQDGLHVFAAGDDGIDVTGSHLAGYFAGSIQITGSCIGCELATFAVNAADRPLQPGDVVALRDLRRSDIEGLPVLMAVESSQSGGTAIGVVRSRAELVVDPTPRPGAGASRLVPQQGEAVPGDYLTLVYAGLVQVRADAAAGAIVRGERLVAAGDGAVHAAYEQPAGGMADAAAVVGTALENLDTGTGLIWVLVDLG